MKVIGIDPGYERLGIAIVEKTSGQEILLYSDCIQTSAKLPFTERLQIIGQTFEKIIKEWKPDALAMEKLFFTNNQKTAMHVAEVRGMISYLSAQAGLIIGEFTPMEIKMSVSGYGGADKKQVISIVSKLVKIEKTIKHDDEYDAIAVALTYFAYEKIRALGSQKSKSP